jgi:hypothetical protein
MTCWQGVALLTPNFPRSNAKQLIAMSRLNHSHFDRHLFTA